MTQTAVVTVLSPTITPTTPAMAGNVIVFTSDGGVANSPYDFNKEEIYSMTASGGNITRLTSNTSCDAYANWSHDGNKIAFMSFRTGGIGQIYVMNADGSNQVKLTNMPTNAITPAWSPDGTRIVFVCGAGDNGELWLINADGSGLTRLTENNKPDGEPDWSPDGSKIIYTSTMVGNIEQLFTIKPDGTNVTQITFDQHIHRQPSYSPDGTKIVYMIHQSVWDSPYIICTMNPDGSNQKEISGLYSWSPAWSPDGSKIAYQAGSVVSKLYIMNADGSGNMDLLVSAGHHQQPDWK